MVCLVNGKCFPYACGESVTAVVGWNALRMSVKSRWLLLSVQICVFTGILSTCLSLLRRVMVALTILVSLAISVLVIPFLFSAVALLVHVKIKLGIMCYLEEVELLIIMRFSSFSLVMFFVLKSTLSDVTITTAAFFD